MSKPTATTKTTSQPNPKKNSPTSEIDLSQLTISQLRSLKTEVDAMLAPDIPELGMRDVVLEYSVRLRTKDGVFCENTGSSRMNSLLNLRLLAEAPSRLEHEFMQQVYGPLKADAYELFDINNPTQHSLDPISTHVGNKFDVMPGLPVPIIGQTLPGE